MSIETLNRLSLGSSETQVSQSHPMDGTPVDVPVPRNVSFIKNCHRDHRVSKQILKFSVLSVAKLFLPENVSARELLCRLCLHLFFGSPNELNILHSKVAEQAVKQPA